MGACYLLEFPNGKVYVGITTKTVEERFASHWKESGFRNRPLHNALRKYGPESVRVHTLAESEDWPTLCEYERTFIALFGSQDRTLGYNCTSGGDGVADPSDGVREKIGAATRERWSDPRYKEKMSDANRRENRRKWADPVCRERMIHAVRQRKSRALAALAENVPDYGTYTGMGYTEPVDFVDRVRVAVQCSPLGYRQLAKAAGVGQATILNLTTRHRHPTDATLRKLAEALGVEP